VEISDTHNSEIKLCISSACGEIRREEKTKNKPKKTTFGDKTQWTTKKENFSVNLLVNKNQARGNYISF